MPDMVGMRSAGTRSFVSFVALALALLLAACGPGTPAPATTSRTPSQSASAVTAFAAAIPIALPAVQGTGPGGITFANILDHVPELPEVAWSRVQETIAANPDVPLDVDIHVGPHTTLNIIGGESRIEEVLARTARLWSGFAQSPYVSVIAYGADDEPWAEDTWKDIVASRGYSSVNVDGTRAIRGNCQSGDAPGVFTGPVTECGGANGGSVTGSDDATIAVGQVADTREIYRTAGGVFGHEYTHAAQAGNWIGSPACEVGLCDRSGESNRGFSPCWIHEGLPQTAGVAAASETLDDYLEWAQARPYGWGPTTVTDYSQGSLLEYLHQTAETCYDDGELYTLGYSVGSLATEALIAIAGPQAAMALFALGAEGEDFETAFEGVYGITWEEAADVLSKVVAAEYESFGPPPF